MSHKRGKKEYLRKVAAGEVFDQDALAALTDKLIRGTEHTRFYNPDTHGIRSNSIEAHRTARSVTATVKEFDATTDMMRNLFSRYAEPERNEVLGTVRSVVVHLSRSDTAAVNYLTGLKKDDAITAMTDTAFVNLISSMGTEDVNTYLQRIANCPDNERDILLSKKYIDFLRFVNMHQTGGITIRKYIEELAMANGSVAKLAEEQLKPFERVRKSGSSGKEGAGKDNTHGRCSMEETQNKILNAMSGKMRRVLVLDDSKSVRLGFKAVIESFYGASDENRKLEDTTIFVIPENIEAGLETLRSESFSLLLLDGFLGLSLNSENNNDGNVIASRLRSGYYGDINRNVTIINISSAYVIEGAVCHVDKERLEEPGFSELIKVFDRLEGQES